MLYMYVCYAIFYLIELKPLVLVYFSWIKLTFLNEIRISIILCTCKCNMTSDWITS